MNQCCTGVAVWMIEEEIASQKDWKELQLWNFVFISEVDGT